LAHAKKQGWGLAPGQAAGGGVMRFFTPLRSVKNRTGQTAPQGPRQHPVVTALAPVAV